MERNKWIILFFGIIFLYTGFVSAQTIDESSVKTAFVLNFLENCYWPENSIDGKYTFLVYGEESELTQNFQKQIASREFHGFAIDIKTTTRAEDLATANIIYITTDKVDEILDIFQNIIDKPILVITDNASYQHELMINLVKRKNKIGYQINPLKLVRQGLKFDKQLLIYAENSMDYPDQFVEMEKDLADQKKRISEQEQIIKKRESDTKLLEERIRQMSTLLASYESTITQHKDQISLGKTVLDSLNQLLTDNQEVLLDYMDSISSNRLWINHQESEITAHSDQIEEQISTINKQQELLTTLENRVKNQRQSMDQQESIISHQTDLLIIFSVLAVVIIILGMLTFIAYRNSRKARLILKQQNEEIAESQILLQNQTTKLKKAKEQIEEYNLKLEDINANLEKQVLQRTKHLTKTNKELDRFVYSVSHDIKAPLASILGIVNLMKYEKLEPNVIEYISKIEISIKKLNLFILEVLEFSRNARTKLKKEEIDLEQLIYNVFDDLKYLHENRKVDLIVDIQEFKSFYGDKARLVIILKNIISNSLKYYNPNRGSCSIIINGNISDNKCKLTIYDNGQGIKAEHIDRLCDMFYRAHENSEGSGLGLYIVKETLDKIKGKIQINSEPGKGTTVKLVIPNRGSGHNKKIELSLN